MPACRTSNSRFTSRFGFTIVEILVVVSIIGLLLAILLPSLGAANRRARKTGEMNSIRQVGQAWLMYGNSNNDSALPGYLDVAVQAPRSPGVRGWGVQYKYPDGSAIPPAPNYTGTNNIAGPWTWRLASYFDHSQEILLGYRPEGDIDFYFEDVATNPTKALEIAEQPAFGYNGFYVGGMWQMVNVQESQGNNVQMPRYRFHNHCEINNPNTTERAPLVIPTKLGQIRRASDLIVFCSSTRLNAGSGVQGPFSDSVEGSHLIVPPTRGTQVQYYADQNIRQDQVIVEGGDLSDLPFVYVPLARHTRTAAILFADGRVGQETYQALYDQRKWIDSATTATYQHDVCGGP